MKNESTIQIGDRYTTANKGCSQVERDAAMDEHREPRMTQMAPDYYTVSRLSSRYVWLTSDHGFTRRISRRAIAAETMQWDRVRYTSSCVGVFRRAAK